MSTSKKNQNNNVTEETQQKPEKVMTKYDRKMAAYKAQQEKEAKEKMITKVVLAVIVALLVAFVASFPIRTWIALNKAVFTLNGEKVTQLELDYQYAVARTNYLNSYGSYLSMFGITDLTTIDTMEYSTDMTFGDYFQQLAVEGLTNNRALLKEAAAEGFTYDTTEEYNELMDTLVSEAKEQNVTLNKYLQALFGKYATSSRIKPIQENTLLAAAYYNEVQKRNLPSDEEIENYYQENKQDYDSVDYYLLTVDADLTLDHIASTDYEGGEELTDEEKAKRMAKAYEEAEKQLKIIEKEGELQENVTYSSASYLISDYLFEEERKAGDSEIFEDTSNSRYMVVKFVKRYLSKQNTVDMFAIVVDEEDPQTILDGWKNGEATEDSFKALAKEYAEETGLTSEGFFEGIDASSLDEELSAWLLDDTRKSGDAEAFTTDDGYGYVLYYVGANKPVYYQSIKSTLSSDFMAEYMETLTRDANIQDPDQNLVYLHITEKTEEDTASAEETDTTGDTTEEGAETIEDTTSEETETSEASAE